MKSIHVYLLMTAAAVNSVSSFGGSEEKFIKKFAMMKVYESCFGQQVLKEIRKEMRDAAQKCSDPQPVIEEKNPNKNSNTNLETSTTKQPPTGDWYNSDTPFKMKPNANGVKIKKPIHTADTLLLQQWSEEQKHTQTESSTSEEHDQVESDSTSGTETESSMVSSKKPVDISKLEEAILNIGRPMASLALAKPTPASNKFHQATPLGYYPPMYYPPPIPFPPAYPYHAHYYPGYFQSPAPIGSPAAFQSIFRNRVRSAKITNFNGRKAKQSDLKTQIESVAFQYNTKIRNVSCIMQELGYLDGKLEPNYSKIYERVSKLSIEDELKKDMLEGIRFCRQFSQCIPEAKRDSQLSKELLRPMFFFKCYKHKKLESCIMKDIRERVSQTSAEFNNEVRRSFTKTNDIVGPIFDSLFGFNSEDMDTSLF